jgi:Arc/MetJ-type ribon-helix-helix transcriptional regulator
MTMAWPTTSDPRTEFITLRLTVSEADDVDWLQGQTNAKNRSDTVRKALDRVIASERRRAAKARKGGTTPGPGVLAGADDTVGSDDEPE